jgi:hypothetical protein
MPANAKPHWLSLMYSTGALLIFCGIPAGFIVGYFISNEEKMGFRASIISGASIALASGIIGIILAFSAEIINKARRTKKSE